MPRINHKFELKLKWVKYYVVASNGTKRADANYNNVIYTIKDSKLYILIDTLSAKDNQKLSKLLRKGFERSVCWIEYKAKCENKNTTNEYRYFWNQTLYKLTDCLSWFTDITILKGIKPKVVIYQKVLSRIIVSSSTDQRSVTNPLILI